MIETTAGDIIDTAKMKETFLAAYIENPIIKEACKKIHLERRTFYHWLKNDEQFAKEFNVRKDIVITFLEDEAYRRAVIGVKKPVYQGGEQVGTITEFSDSLLALLLKANAPEKYNKDKATINNNNFNLTEAKIIHVNSNKPLASSEEDILLDAPLDIGYEEILPARSAPENKDDELLNSI